MNRISSCLSFASYLLVASTASAQFTQCKDGACQLPAHRVGYSRNSLSSACTDGTCGLQGQCQECGCEYGNCKHSNCPGCNSSLQYRQDSLQSPRPDLVPRESAAVVPREVRWLKDYRQSVQYARQSGRPILMRVSAEWCGHCKRMERDTFSHQDVVRTIESHFIGLSVDADEQRRLAESLDVQSLPALVVVTPDLRIVKRIEGYRSARDLNVELTRLTRRAELQRDVKVAMNR